LPCLVALFLLAFASPTKADPILYTFSGHGTGTIGVQSFNNAAFTINVLSDTASVISTGTYGGRPMWSAESLSTTFTIAGIGSGTFTLGTRVFDTQGGQFLGLSQSLSLGGYDMWDYTNSAFLDYDLQHAIGPISNVNHALFSANMENQPTTLGNLNFSPPNNITFQAAIVPEPSTCTLLALYGLVGLRRILKRNTRPSCS
jgi:hypothetical protein